MRLAVLASTFAGVALAFAIAASAQAAPLSVSRAGAEAAPIVEAPVLKAVTAVGVAHRSARRTARRTSRRNN